jgi:branched-chain amino acid transport system ATP-binding protein
VLARLKTEGQAIVLIDKTFSAVMRLADRHVILERDRVAWSGSSEALAAAPELRETYLHL